MPDVITRRKFLRAAVAACASTAGVAATAKPNVIVILADDIGYGDLGCYGATKVKTPNLDLLAAKGLRFTDGHSAAATCTPTRYAMMTGEYAFRKKGTNILPGDANLIVDPGRPTIQSIFKQAGYSTGVVGKWHLGLGKSKIELLLLHCCLRLGNQTDPGDQRGSWRKRSCSLLFLTCEP